MTIYIFDDPIDSNDYLFTIILYDNKIPFDFDDGILAFETLFEYNNFLTEC